MTRQTDNQTSISPTHPHTHAESTIISKSRRVASAWYGGGQCGTRAQVGCEKRCTFAKGGSLWRPVDPPSPAQRSCPRWRRHVARRALALDHTALGCVKAPLTRCLSRTEPEGMQREVKKRGLGREPCSTSSIMLQQGPRRSHSTPVRRA